MKQKEQNNREANTWIQKSVKKAKEDWIGSQCKEIETCLKKKKKKKNSNSA